MSYNEQEYDDMMQENMPLDGDALHDEHMSSHGNLTKISNFETHENKSAFGALNEEIGWGTKIDLEFVIVNNRPYYKFTSVSFSEDESFSETKSLHLNNKIISFLYNYFENNNLGTIPTDYAGFTNAGEKFLLHLLKRDQQNGKLSHDPETGYKTTYNHITINYGKLPYTPEELFAKLESL